MKNWLYIPFLLLMAVTYTRLASNFNSEESFKALTRGPASEPIAEQLSECLNVASQFNPRYGTEVCL